MAPNQFPQDFNHCLRLLRLSEHKSVASSNTLPTHRQQKGFKREGLYPLPPPPLFSASPGSPLRPIPRFITSAAPRIRTTAPLASPASSVPIPLGPPESRWMRSGRGRRGGGVGPAFKQNPSFPLNSHSPRLVSKWVSRSSLHSSHFPVGSELPESEHAFPAVFSHSLQSPLLLDPVDAGVSRLDFVEDAAQFLWQSSEVHQHIWSEEALRRVFDEDPPWFSHAFLKEGGGMQELGKSSQRNVGKWKYNALRRRQVKVETEAWERAAEEYREMQREMIEKKLAPNLPYVKTLFLGWFEPLRDAIAKEQKLQKTKRQKAAYASHIGLLPADKMAVIVMHKMMGLLMTGQEDGCVRVIQAAVHIGDAIEKEVRIHNFLEKTKRKGKQEGKRDTSVSREQELLRNRVTDLLKKKKMTAVQNLVRSEDETKWSRDAQAKLGSRLIELLIESAYVQSPLNQLAENPPDIRPAFSHVFRTVSKEDRKCGKRYGVIECDPLVHEGLDSTAKHTVIPYMPMLIPPKKWKGYEKGGHLFLPSYVMRTHGARQQQDAIKKVSPKQLQKVFQALDTLGSTEWRVNKRVLGVVETIWNKGGCIAGLVDCEDIPIPAKPESDDIAEIQTWRWDSKKAKKINNERHALRCDTELKLLVARKMRDEEGFYYPHNLDFRGRAYPMHSHLNHLSSDLCRGVLEFAEGRPLGKSGLRWLKIQLANLYSGGIEKLPLDDRLAFVEDNMNYVLDSADRPIDGKQWWLSAEDPFQCLAACINLSDALKSPSPYNVISHLPIHQDGSCNGLQHYAALGRDSMEAAAVNLVAGDKPADVYSGIAIRVLEYMKRDSEKDPTTYPNALLAKILVDQVDRKLVKQTVMTSVYGVTYIGAREQIKKRLDERGLTLDERMLFSASCYAAKVTMTALGEMFQAARGIMKWLADCAKVIASENQPVRWTTPLGLPVVQPYMKSERHLIRTSLQVLALQRESDMVAVKRQKTAFPPNFIHSLDGSHMMMTAIACKNAGLHFAGVHDSFWTHACDVDKMNTILREQFVELYDIPILEDLLESFRASYPTLEFPSLPERGDFDLQEVLRSPYFFN